MSLALVPAWFWVALGIILALAGLVLGVWYSRDRAYRPSHRLRARDVVALTEAEGREACAHCGMPALGYARGYSNERLCHHEDRDCYHQVTVYGSMIRDEEFAAARAYVTECYGGIPPSLQHVLDMGGRFGLPAEVAHGEPTAAEVAASRAAHGYIPELDAGNDQPDPYLDALTAQYGSEFEEVMPDAAVDQPGRRGGHVSPGPGGLSSLTSGPDQAPIRGDAQGRAGGCAPSESRPAARADLTGSLSPRHHEEDPGWLAHGQPGLTRLADTGDIAAAHQAHPGPDTERLVWLDQQLAAHLEWARRMRGQVTGWDLEVAA